jgi:hypothetical protein
VRLRREPYDRDVVVARVGRIERTAVAGDLHALRARADRRVAVGRELDRTGHRVRPRVGADDPVGVGDRDVHLPFLLLLAPHGDGCRGGEDGQAGDDECDAGPADGGEAFADDEHGENGRDGWFEQGERGRCAGGHMRQSPAEQDVAGEHGHQRHVGADGHVGPGVEERGAGDQGTGMRSSPPKPKTVPIAAREVIPGVIGR